MWVAAAVNLGIIDIENDLTDLTDTSFSEAHDIFAEEVDDYFSTSSNCAFPSFFQDGWCDQANNVHACKYDGGDCCLSTCGVGYLPTYRCGINGFRCMNPDASDTGTRQHGSFSYYYYYYDDTFSDIDDFENHSSVECVDYILTMNDELCDGWEGNSIQVGNEKVLQTFGIS